MTFPVDDILLGPDAFGQLHRLDGIIFHTGEEPGFSRQLAVNTAVWQLTHPGSYNFRIYDRATDPRGVMLNVPWREGSGGLAAGVEPAWDPERFPFLAGELEKAGPCPVAGCAGPYRNPTMHHLQVSFVGRTDQLDAGLAPANYVPDARQLVEWAETHPDRGSAPLVLSKHGHWQNNRTDCGEWAYSRIAAAPHLEADMPTPLLDYVPQLWRARPGGAELREQAALVSPVIAIVPEGGIIFTVGEDPRAGVRWRLAVAGDPERLFYVPKAQIDPLDPTPRDPELYSGIAAVVNARAAGNPIPSGGVPQAEHDIALETIETLEARVAAKDAHVAQYPKG